MCLAFQYLSGSLSVDGRRRSVLVDQEDVQEEHIPCMEWDLRRIERRDQFSSQ